MDLLLVAFDLDGTALYDDKTFSPRLLEDIKKLYALGTKIVPITGRPLSLIPQTILDNSELFNLIVLCNGAEIRNFSDKKVLYRNPMQNESVIAFQKFADEHDFPIYFHTTIGTFITETSLEIDKKYVKINERVAGHYKRIIVRKVTPKKNIYDIIQKEPSVLKIDVPIIPPTLRHDVDSFIIGKKINAAWTNNDMFEVTEENATKGNGLEFVCDHLNVSLEKTFAIGDSGNDITMFQKAGFSVAMGNSLQEVKDTADAVTLSNNEDGVAVAVEKYVLEQL